MIAKKCDRCGMYYELYNTDPSPKRSNGVMFLNIDAYQKYFSHKPIDLCPSCMESLYSFLQKNERFSE